MAAEPKNQSLFGDPERHIKIAETKMGKVSVYLTDTPEANYGVVVQMASKSTFPQFALTEQDGWYFQYGKYAFVRLAFWSDQLVEALTLGLKAINDDGRVLVDSFGRRWSWIVEAALESAFSEEQLAPEDELVTGIRNLAHLPSEELRDMERSGQPEESIVALKARINAIHDVADLVKAALKRAEALRPRLGVLHVTVDDYPLPDDGESGLAQLLRRMAQNMVEGNTLAVNKAQEKLCASILELLQVYIGSLKGQPEAAEFERFLSLFEDLRVRAEQSRKLIEKLIEDYLAVADLLSEAYSKGQEQGIYFVSHFA